MDSGKFSSRSHYKSDSSQSVNYKLDILITRDVQRHQFNIKTKKQKINNFVALLLTC